MQKQYNIVRDNLLFSILICTINERKHLLSTLLQELNKQKADDVEILVNIDNGQKSIGRKRNELLLQARGKYISFIDDDDKVSEDYIQLILEAAKLNPDCVGIEGLITFSLKNITRKFVHSIRYDKWFTKDNIYCRCPNHLSPVKRELALKVMFPEKNFGEDKEYSLKLFPLLRSEVYILSPIYYYLTK